MLTSLLVLQKMIERLTSADIDFASMLPENVKAKMNSTLGISAGDLNSV